MNKEISALKNAGTKLTSYGIKVGEFQPSELVKLPDLIQLMQDTGISCILEEPTKDDYGNAHRRACLRESPHPPDIKSDEMRDLVIWEISIRIAKDDNGAILMSRDEVHTHHRGDKEASECNLIRCNSIERAYETLSIETISSQKIKDLLGNVWSDLVSSNLPLVDGSQVVSIKNPIFKYTTEGSSIVTCGINFHTGDGKELAAFLEMEYADDHPFRLDFSDMKIDGEGQAEDVSLCFEKPAIPESDLQDRIDKLKELLRG